MSIYADLPTGKKPTTLRLSRAAKRDLRIKDLCSSMRKSLLVMKRYRENYKKLIRLFAGADWSDNAADLRRPWNGIGLYCMIVSRALINDNPRGMLSTWRTEYQRDVWTAQEWGNRQFKKINLGDQIHRAVNDALLWMGIIKTGITSPIDSERMGFRTWAGEVFSMAVSPDDYLADVFAKNFDELAYEGHRYRGGVEISNRYFKLTGDEKLTGTSPKQFNLEGDERAELIGRGYLSGGADEFNEATDLWEVHVKAHNAVLTFRSQDGGAPAGEADLLEANEYVGPYCGQYTKFGYVPVQSNLFPKGPAMDLLPLDMSINNQLRKILRQAERCKTQEWFTGAASDDMKRINDHDDGDAVQINRPNEIISRTMGEPNPKLLMVAAQMMQIFNKIAGNLDTMGGLARMAGTAAQEQQLNTNASGSLAMLQQLTTRKVAEVMENCFWYWWKDPLGVMHATYKGIRSDPTLSVERVLHPSDRQQLAWEDLDVTVDPYSLTNNTPQSKLQHIRSLIQASIPIMQFLQQQNVVPDAMFWMQKEGEYANNPDIQRLFRMQEPVPGSTPQSSDQGATKSPVSQRTYTRKNESEQTDEGMQDDMIQRMMGAGMSLNGSQNGQGGTQ
jgi:hypothetical protein